MIYTKIGKIYKLRSSKDVPAIIAHCEEKKCFVQFGSILVAHAHVGYDIGAVGRIVADMNPNYNYAYINNVNAIIDYIEYLFKDANATYEFFGENA